MANIAARIVGAAAAPALLCAFAGAAFADPPQISQQQITQRPAEQGSAQRTCMPHDGADDQLRKQFGEKVLGHGVSGDGTLVEIFQSSSGTFTVIKTTPEGMSCVVDFGEGWQTVNQLQEAGFTPDDLKSVPTPY
ncbi:MAG TPA: hypothetical protein VFE34_19330 [Dongiaceae bacterium]|jgi:hypothetical protein|nr:hypothetical protein [Dongiaceae bacterium]